MPLPFAPQNVVVLPPQTGNRRTPSAPGIENSVGMLVRDEGKGTVMIGVNSLHHLHRQRFTIAHECGHLVLHEGIRRSPESPPSPCSGR